MKKNLKYLLPLATLLLLLSACQEPEMEVFSSHPSVPSTTVLPKPSPGQNSAQAPAWETA